ncbi:TetR/AcrR family transcriptional regulator [Cohnella sp. GCM10027633]|uniref:TetR/AcrR family transcriptional regulator n=1 Tax=unclassified Cohnella TaxID=2636738 RepID=UPI00363F9756
MNDNDVRVVNTKKALHGALLALLKTTALETINVSSLCREAGVSRGAFYLHYKDVGSLFDEHVLHLLKDLEDSFYEPYRHVARLVPSDLDPSTIRIFHHVKKYQPFYEIVFDKRSSLSYYYALLDKIKSLILESASNDLSEVKDVGLLLAFQANAIMGMLILWNEEGYDRSPEQMNERLTYMLKLQGNGFSDDENRHL